MWAFLSCAWIGLACFDFFAGWTLFIFRVSTRSRFDLVPFHADSLVETEDPGLSGQEALGRPSVLHVVPLGVTLFQVARALEKNQVGPVPIIFCSSHCLTSHCSHPADGLESPGDSYFLSWVL